MFDGDMRIFGTFDTKKEAIAERLFDGSQLAS